MTFLSCHLTAYYGPHSLPGYRVVREETPYSAPPSPPPEGMCQSPKVDCTKRRSVSVVDENGLPVKWKPCIDLSLINLIPACRRRENNHLTNRLWRQPQGRSRSQAPVTIQIHSTKWHTIILSTLGVLLIKCTHTVFFSFGIFLIKYIVVDSLLVRHPVAMLKLTVLSNRNAPHRQVCTQLRLRRLRSSKTEEAMRARALMREYSLRMVV
jgi:hypothetical protein